MIGMEMKRKGLIVAVLVGMLILPATIGSVYATHVDPNKRLKVQVEAQEKVSGELYILKLLAMGPNGNSLTGDGQYKFKGKGEDMNLRKFQITGSEVRDDGHLIILWALDGTDIVVINITINNGSSVTGTTPIGSHTFTGESVKVDVKNLGP